MMSSLSDIEWTRAYHILRGDGADIDGVGESPLHHHLRGLILDCLEVDRIQISLAAPVAPRHHAILARRHAGDREDAKPVGGSGAYQGWILPVEGIEQHGAIGQRFVLGIPYHPRDDAARTRDREVQTTPSISGHHKPGVQNFPTTVSG